jgi:hypothetical protein
MEIKYVTSRIYNYTRQIPSRVNNYLENISKQIHEKRIERNFQIHDYTTDGNPAEIIYQMREPIARFARKNGVKIDVYDSRTPVNTDGITSYYADKNASKNLVVTVRDTKKANAKVRKELINGDPDATHTLERVRMYIVDVPGEDTKVARQVRSIYEDTMLKHFFRKIDTLVKETVYARTQK